MIHAEGIESLSTKELQHACQSRGIRFTGVSPARLREELEQWIDLHYTNKISGVLLVLSRAFHFDQTGDSVLNSLEATLSSLPDNLVSLRLPFVLAWMSGGTYASKVLCISSTKRSSTSPEMRRHTSRSSRCC